MVVVVCSSPLDTDLFFGISSSRRPSLLGLFQLGIVEQQFATLMIFCSVFRQSACLAITGI